MVEGAGSDDYRLVKTMLYARPDLMHRILAVNADAVAAYLNAQIDAGAQAGALADALAERGVAVRRFPGGRLGLIPALDQIKRAARALSGALDGLR